MGRPMPSKSALYHGSSMPFPIKVCAVCSEEFELKPDKPGFANRCPACSETEAAEPATRGRVGGAEHENAKEANEARRQAMRELLYRRQSGCAFPDLGRSRRLSTVILKEQPFSPRMRTEIGEPHFSPPPPLAPIRIPKGLTEAIPGHPNDGVASEVFLCVLAPLW